MAFTPPSYLPRCQEALRVRQEPYGTIEPNGNLPSSSGTRLASDFLTDALACAVAGDLDGYASCLRLAAEFATEAAREATRVAV